MFLKIYINNKTCNNNIIISSCNLLPGWNIERLPSVCPNTALPFFFGCHLNRQMSERKLCASLCTVTPLSGPEIVQIYNGPLWETNATASSAFQHQLSEAGTPEIFLKSILWELVPEIQYTDNNVLRPLLTFILQSCWPLWVIEHSFKRYQTQIQRVKII